MNLGDIWLQVRLAQVVDRSKCERSPTLFSPNDIVPSEKVPYDIGLKVILLSGLAQVRMAKMV